jgi:flagellar basal body-associated protein FliL
MSDKPKKEAAAEEGGEKKKGGIMALLTKLPVLLGGVMIIEAAVLFGAFKMLSGGPKEVEGAELQAKEGETKAKAEDGTELPAHAELLAVEFRAPNKRTGRTFLYDVAIFVSVPGEKMEEAKKMLEQRKALITDRVRTIIAQSEPDKLGGGSEPGLETLRRQVKHQLDEILGPGVIDEVLVPRCIPFRTDF